MAYSNLANDLSLKGKTKTRYIYDSHTEVCYGWNYLSRIQHIIEQVSYCFADLHQFLLEGLR